MGVSPDQLAAAAGRARWAEQVLHDASLSGATRVAHIDDPGIYGLLFDHHRAGIWRPSRSVGWGHCWSTTDPIAADSWTPSASCSATAA